MKKIDFWMSTESGFQVIDSVAVEENATREEINEIVKDEILNRVGWDWYAEVEE